MDLCLFDLDHTLITLDSDHEWGEFMITIGWADAHAHRATNDAFYAQYQAGRLDLDAYIDFATRPWRDRSQAELAQAQARFMREVIEPAIPRAARALVEEHRARGDRVAIVTATNEFVTAPIARAFDVASLIAIELERDGAGRVTGRIRGVPSYREGKVERVREWLAADGLSTADFNRISVYSDSPNDLPLLEMATDAVATNPTPALEAVARERGWRLLNLSS
ncbi:HAD family hydrolase [Caldimonas sp. KR1-144]|uniref:histidinol-phosphatase n=1 Tax=Caldimonas sp. KR1-144 TaxID=3400911 RepID=UPI003C0C75F6